MKKLQQVTSLLLIAVMILSVCGCSLLKDDSSVLSQEIIIEYIQADLSQYENIASTGTSDDNSTQSGVNDSQNTISDAQSGNESSDVKKPNTTTSENNSQTSSEEEINPNASTAPDVTLCAQVASHIYIVGGTCSANTEYITVGGAGVKTTTITPTKGKDKNYFIGQVSLNFDTIVEIQGKETGKDLSKKITKFLGAKIGMKNMMTETDYRPVFGSDSRMHFYSAILSYTMSNKVNSGIKDAASYYMGDVADVAKNVGAEVIYLVIPSSAAVYPETVPTEYKAASGESIYEAFESVAKQCGATVIYPLDTMKAHKNDGDGYKIYSHTDSHWTTYGAYWGISELMNYISGKYPSAKPRTVSEMGFYTDELYGGDALFSFGDYTGFENYSQAGVNGGATKITGIKELTTLYTLKMPTDTLSKITRNKKSIYLTKDNEGAKTETNPNGTGLPSAVVVRDSFGRTAYDMINDRFSKVDWLAEGDYESVVSQVYAKRPNYVIYIVSERNLLKVMLNNKDIALVNF